MNPPPLRIAQLNSSLSGGGTDDQCVKLAAGLRRLGQSVWVVGPDGRDYSKIIRTLEIPFEPTPPEGFLKTKFMLGAARFIRRERIQIVHGHHGRDLWPTILAARFSGTRPRIVLSRHLAKSPGTMFSRGFLLGNCDALIAVSDFVARVLKQGVYEPAAEEQERRKRGPIFGNLAKIQVVQGGIDTGSFRPFDAAEQRREWGLQPQDFAFVIAGSYDLPRGKGQREYLEAAARIQAKIPHAKFLIVGRGNMDGLLRADIERLGLQGRAWLTPYCRNMPAAMNALDCLVHCQVGTEAFGLVLLEAFACGRPVIASALDGIPEAFATTGFGRLIKPDSVDELAAAMLEWAARAPLGDRERAALHEKVAASHSIEAYAGRMLKCYEGLVRE